jgi:hypothetical protein
VIGGNLEPILEVPSQFLLVKIDPLFHLEIILSYA